ncbi:MAG: endoglucanase A [Armatimonadetes bacterium]|nr:endoglucanase A [Armatimonadota bacterium]
MILTLLLAPAVLSQTPLAVTIDATQKTAISPYIYGVNYPEWEGFKIAIPFARQGGNRMSAYNWETNASNAGNDFRHQNDNYMGSSYEPAWTLKTFMKAAQNRGATVLLTVPTLGYVSADKRGDGDVANTPNYLETRFLRSYPRKPDGNFEFPPNTGDKAVYQDELVRHIESVKSPKTPVWYSLDNEPDLWFSTHARICPKPLTYQQIIDNNVAYASAIKAVAPKALIFGPANYGWMGFRRFQDAPDAQGRDFLDVYLAAMKEAERKAGKRLLDVLDIHWYPEAKGDGVRITGGGPDKPGTPVARVQAPRSLWDPTYVEDSWITKDFLKGRPIALLPGVQEQIRKQYPGTKLAITEYDFGGKADISGAIAQADVLGLFGKYGVFAAANWGFRPGDTGTLAGYRAFLDMDGRGRRFGSLGLAVSGVPVEKAAVYAAMDPKTPGWATLVVINRNSSPLAFQFAIKGFVARKAMASAYTAQGLVEPKPVQATVARGRVTFTAPPMSLCPVLLKS